MKNKREPRVLGGTRRVFRIGASVGITLPSEFARAHGIKVGDDLAYAANHLMKIIPMPEEQFNSAELEPKKPPVGKVQCPHCHRYVLPSALESHILNYCPKAPAKTG